jgi:hypothetical protein
LWGNVASYKDALKCLQLTLRSLAFAAQSVLAGCRPVGAQPVQDWTRADQMVAEVKGLINSGKKLRTHYESKEAAEKARADRTLQADIARALADMEEYSREEARARAAHG